uniref:Uncharacterized protein n=1 Tax=Lepeophtheirus salmonis TaxID=72036 RepID=A0A0K2TI95_LEPSM
MMRPIKRRNNKRILLDFIKGIRIWLIIPQLSIPPPRDRWPRIPPIHSTEENKSLSESKGTDFSHKSRPILIHN